MGVSILFAGCTGSKSSDGDDTSPTPTTEETDTATPAPQTPERTKSVGQSVTYGGLKMAVTEVKTADAITEDGDEQTPEQGAVFVLTYIRIENVGDTEIHYPERGGDVQMVYKEEEAGDEFVGNEFTVDGKTYATYSGSMDETGADAGAYPDTVVKGWAVFELPEDFDRDDAAVSIRYSDTSHESIRFRWMLG